MDRQFPACVPLGHLYDPMLQLAKHVRHAVANQEKMVWADENGYVFATPIELLQSLPPHTTIGVYGKGTPL